MLAKKEEACNSVYSFKTFGQNIFEKSILVICVKVHLSDMLRKQHLDNYQFKIIRLRVKYVDRRYKAVMIGLKV